MHRESETNSSSLKANIKTISEQTAAPASASTVNFSRGIFIIFIGLSWLKK
jgi:hypothetical protein